MKTIVILAFLFLSSFISSGQIKITEGSYRTFDSRLIAVYIVEGEFSVLNIDKTEIKKDQVVDLETLTKLLNRVDALYAFYKNNLGYEPAGGNSLYKNKVNVFFGQPSCGAGCGLVGAKGIEVAFFQQIFNKFKRNLLNSNPDRIIGYEFGRNFFTFSSKISFPFTPNTSERNGGFAEGFANVLYTYAYDEIMKLPEERILNEELSYLTNIEEIYFGYISDTLATPYNFLAKWDGSQGITDSNRRIGDPAYTAFGILHGTIKTFGKDRIFPNLFKELKQMPDAKTVEDALSNLALATSKSLNTNLLAYFENVLKFKINENIRQEIIKYPLLKSKLIKIEEVLWFISPFDKIRLGMRSTNYLSDKSSYKLYVGNKMISSSKDGNFNLDYSLLNGAAEIELRCELIDENSLLLDSFKTKLKKRHNFNLLLYPKMLSNSYQFAGLSLTTLLDNQIIIKNETEEFDNCIVSYNLIIPKDRTIELGGDILHKQKANFENKSWTSITTGNGFYIQGTARVGLDLGKDPTKYFTVKQTAKTNLYFRPWNKIYESMSVSISQEGLGRPTSYIKNVIIKDITDSDGDGFVDFEDNCPSVSGKYVGCPETITSNEQSFQENILIFPNPVIDRLTISGTENGLVNIYDLMGKLCFTKYKNSHSLELDLSELKSGSYYLTINNSQKRIKTFKLVSVK